MTGQIRLEDIPVGEGRAFAIHGEQIAVFRLRDGTMRALAAICPHRGGPLADGLLDDRVVVCPLHGFTYDLTSGTEVSNDGSPVCAYDVSVDSGGAVLVRPRATARVLSDAGLGSADDSWTEPDPTA